ncbi:MAG: rhodanese-like domain-containing protein [Anaerolineae bacterium]|jgi:thiosulfate/3-mercaptopyruvate sulfurtransferase
MSERIKEMRNRRAPEVLVTMSRALQILESYAPEVLVVEVVSEFYQGPSVQDHRRSHPLPGFVQVKTEQLETGPLWNLEPDGHLQRVLAESGLVPGAAEYVLLFDNIQLACGTAQSRFDASARLLSVLYYFGFSQAAIILDPGIHPSFADEFAVRRPQVMRRLASRPFPSGAGRSPGNVAAPGRWTPKHPDHFVSHETMVQLLAGKLGPYRLLDSRSAEEYAGIFTGYDYIPLAGRIPTAESVVNGDYQVSATEDLESVLGRLAETLARKGIDQHDRIVWYCGTGWRASRMSALTRALGYTNVAVYDGGWNEWHRRHPQDGSEKPSGIEAWGSRDQVEKT